MDTVNEFEMNEEARPQVPVQGKKANCYNIKKWFKYAIYGAVILLTIYSLIMRFYLPNEAVQKEHEKKVESVLDGLYKLMQIANNIPNFAPIGSESDTLDELQEKIFNAVTNFGKATPSP